MSLLILAIFVVSTVAQVCDYENSVELINRNYNGVQYGQGEFFVDNSTGIERGCVCLKETCIRKCCPLGQGYISGLRQCVDEEGAFDPPVWDGSGIKPGFNATASFHVVFGAPICSKANNERKVLLRIDDDNYLKTNGKFYHKIDEDEYETFDSMKYCIDNFITKTKNNETRVMLRSVVCLRMEESSGGSSYYFSSTCMVISCFFMLLTIAVYSILPELRTLHGLVLISYLVSFFVGLLCMASMQIMVIFRDITANICLVLTFIIYFTLLAAFFWLNVLCYNLWRKLSVQSNVSRKSNRRRYMSYSAYAFGIPTIMTLILAGLEFSELSKFNKFLPHIRSRGCFLYGFSKFIYLYVPMLIVCAINLILFILIARRIMEIKKRMQQLKIKHKQRFSLYFELFIVTGLTWIFEVISTFYPDLTYLWLVTDMYNSLVGLMIFIIFVCKKKVFLLIKQRYKQLRGIPVTIKPATSSSRTPSPSREDIPMKTNTLFESM